MKRTGRRARVAIGSAVVAVAGCAVAGSVAAAPESAPPSTPPGSAEPVDTAGDSSPIALDPEREVLVDEIVASAGDSGFPLDRECVAGIVAQLTDDDLVIVSEDIANASDTAIATPVTVTDYTVGTETVPLDTATDETVVLETMPVDTMTVASDPVPSPLTQEIGQQMVMCADGDADPALVAEALEVIQADPEATAFDLECVASVLTTFSDETLTLIIEDSGDVAPTETAASVEVAVATVVPASEPAPESTVEMGATEPLDTDDTGLVDDPLSSFPDEPLTEAFTLLICAPELLAEFESMNAASASAPEPTPETAAADTAVAEPTETTEG